MKKRLFIVVLLLFSLGCVSPGGVKRVRKQLIQQKKESVYAVLVNQSLQKSHADLTFFGVTFTPSITINLVDQSRTGVIDFGPEIVGIQSALRAKKLAYSSICVLDHLGREMECYDKNSLIQFEKNQAFIQAFISLLQSKEDKNWDQFIDFSEIKKEHFNELLDFNGEVNTISIEHFSYFNYADKASFGTTFNLNINHHVNVAVLVELVEGHSRITDINLVSS